jgi:hypothetical protein
MLLLRVKHGSMKILGDGETVRYIFLTSVLHSTLGMCKANDNQHHPEIPIKNTTSNSRRSMVCEQPYAPE